MNDQLGIFGREEGETGDLDVDELRAALAAESAQPTSEDQPPKAPPPTEEERAESARRRHRRWLVFAVVVLLVIVAGLIAGFFICRSTAEVVPDYVGLGDTEVVIRVQGGDAVGDIATTLAEAGVVASAQ